jgi:hypothetical protein
MTTRPLNGTKTHPLTEHGRAALVRLLQGPMPAQEINAGVVNRLTRGASSEWLARTVWLPSPYKSHKGKTIIHLEITDAGKRALPCRN